MKVEDILTKVIVLRTQIAFSPKGKEKMFKVKLCMRLAPRPCR